MWREVEAMVQVLMRINSVVKNMLIVLVGHQANGAQ